MGRIMSVLDLWAKVGAGQIRVKPFAQAVFVLLHCLVLFILLILVHFSSIVHFGPIHTSEK